MDSTTIFLPFLLALLLSILEYVGTDEIESLCRNDQRQYSCGKCIEAHASCSWCMDPDFAGSFRCDSMNNLVGSCPQQHLVKVSDKITKISDRPLAAGSNQLQPQQIQLDLRKGQTATFEIRYLHVSNERSRDVYILNSETESRGLHLSYGSVCNGRRVEGQSCASVRPNDIVIFTVNATLRSCDTRGDIVASIGVAGVREVAALYVTPMCSCPCEAMRPVEHLSHQCSQAGHLVCGACVCTAGHTGRHCECSGDGGQCRQSPDSPLCSGRGHCECGRCKCGDPEIVKGEFCECDITTCPRYEGIMCSGKGTCDCGKCLCEPDRTGEICECPMDDGQCIAKDGSLCNNRGECECGKCSCQENFEGLHCELVADYDQDSTEDQTTPKSSSVFPLKSQSPWKPGNQQNFEKSPSSMNEPKSTPKTGNTSMALVYCKNLFKLCLVAIFSWLMLHT